MPDHDQLDEWFNVGHVYVDATPRFYPRVPGTFWFMDGDYRVACRSMVGLTLEEGITKTCGKSLCPNGPAIALCVLPEGHETKHLPVSLPLLATKPFHVDRIAVSRKVAS